MSFFETKYRILPVYADNNLNGYVVYYKFWWFPFTWLTALLDKWVSSDKDEKGHLEINHSYAYFKTEEEAIKYITYRKTIVNETLRIQKKGNGNTTTAQRG